MTTKSIIYRTFIGVYQRLLTDMIQIVEHLIQDFMMIIIMMVIKLSLLLKEQTLDMLIEFKAKVGNNCYTLSINHEQEVN